MLEGLTPPHRVHPCMIRTVMGDLDETDKAILIQALWDRDTWSNKGLSAALIAKGLPLGENIIRKRRTDPCDGCVCRVD